MVDEAEKGRGRRRSTYQMEHAILSGYVCIPLNNARIMQRALNLSRTLFIRFLVDTISLNSRLIHLLSAILKPIMVFLDHLRAFLSYCIYCRLQMRADL